MATDDPDTARLDNWEEEPSDLVRPYVTGPGQATSRTFGGAMAGSGKPGLRDGYFYTPQTYAFDGLNASADLRDGTDWARGDTTQLLSDRPAEARPQRRTSAPRPVAGFIARQRPVTIIVGLTAAVAGIVFLLLPSHPSGTPTAGHGGTSIASASARPQTSLAVGGQSTMPMPTSGAATSPAVSPTPSVSKAAQPGSAPVTSAAAAAPPPSTSISPSLTPGSVISIEATTEAFSITRGDAGSQVSITQVTSGSSEGARADATWVVHEGLAKSSCVSFESADAPGQYLWHQDFELFVAPDDGSQSFAERSTFCPEPGNNGQGYSFEAFNRPSFFIRHHDFLAFIAHDGGVFSWDTSVQWHSDTSWKIIQPWD